VAELRICFVCLGNICRSPTAEGIFRHLVQEAELEERIEIDSAGTGTWHVGEPPDARAVAAARRRGVELGGRARGFERGDFARFDRVIAMDRDNHRVLLELAPDPEARAKVRLLREFEPGVGDADVPDPYYGESGFDDVYVICEAACRGLLERLRAELTRGRDG